MGTHGGIPSSSCTLKRLARGNCYSAVQHRSSAVQRRQSSKYLVFCKYACDNFPALYSILPGVTCRSANSRCVSTVDPLAAPTAIGDHECRPHQEAGRM